MSHDKRNDRLSQPGPHFKGETERVGKSVQLVLKRAARRLETEWNYPHYTIGDAVMEGCDGQARSIISRSRAMEELRRRLGKCVIVWEEKATKAQVLALLRGDF